jgi:hypothetical protein
MTRLLILIFSGALIMTSTAAVGAPHHHRARHHSASSKAHNGPTITPDSIATASFNKANALDPSLIVKAEILLDRDHFSPGQIDGENGDNFKKALSAFAQANGLPAAAEMDANTWNALTANATDKVLKHYTISEHDVAGPFNKRIPANLVQLAKLPGLSYKTPREELAEKFHMSEALLAELNPGARFDRAGTEIVVADVTPMELRNGRYAVEAAKPTEKETQTGRVATIVIDKPARDAPMTRRESCLAFIRPPLAARKGPHQPALLKCAASPGIRITTTIRSLPGRA